MRRKHDPETKLAALKLAATGAACVPVAQKWLEGGAVQPVVDHRLRAAAEELGIAGPPKETGP